MKEIKLTQGFVAMVDDEDFEYLNQFKWQVQQSKYTFYAISTLPLRYGSKRVRMHRLIMNTSKEMTVDHIDHNGLNNQKYNLRNCTVHQNNMNQGKGSKTKFKGVFARGDKFYAKIQFNKRPYTLGTFNTDYEAALAYDIGAKQMFGEFAYLNFPDNSNQFKQ